MIDYKELIEEIRDSNADGVASIETWAIAIETLLAERDALCAIAKRSTVRNMKECSHYKACFDCAVENMNVMPCASCENWQWRGIGGTDA